MDGTYHSFSYFYDTKHFVIFSLPIQGFEDPQMILESSNTTYHESRISMTPGLFIPTLQPARASRPDTHLSRHCPKNQCNQQILHLRPSPSPLRNPDPVPHLTRASSVQSPFFPSLIPVATCRNFLFSAAPRPWHRPLKLAFPPPSLSPHSPLPSTIGNFAALTTKSMRHQNNR
jgi:hypothetical protein